MPVSASSVAEIAKKLDGLRLDKEKAEQNMRKHELAAKAPQLKAAELEEMCELFAMAGREYCEDLEKRKSLPDKESLHANEAIFQTHYLTKEGDVVLSDESLVQIASWAEDGLIQKPDSSAANGAKMIQTWSRRSGNEYLQHDRTAHNLIDAAGARGGAIICYHNDKYLDGNRGDRLKHLESSEIISQQYLQAAKLQNKKPRSLHSVTRFHVVNHATIGAIEFLGCSKEQNAQETNTYERGSKGFFTLLRTPNAKGVPYMLQDRYVLFGKRDIHSIRVFWNSEWDAWNMQFELRADAEADFGEPSTPMSKKARRQANKSLRSTG